jgi:hypothetical protein
VARNQTLLKLLQDYRSEARLSGNPAHNTNVRESQVRRLQRIQEWLWEEHDWPHLRVERFISVQAGQRFYSPPDDLTIDRIHRIEVRYGEEWCELAPLIPSEAYSQWDSERDERSWPVSRWRIYENDQIELWPIPDDNADAVTLEGVLKITGIRSLRPLVQDDDRSDLDDRMLVLFAAAEELAASGAQDAQFKADAAQKRVLHLTGNASKVKVFRVGGSTVSHEAKLRGPPRVHYRKVP